MAITALTLGGVASASTTLPTAAQLSSNVSGTGGSTPTTLLGTATGYSSVQALGQTSAWQALLDPHEPQGMGLLWDSTTLEGQQLLGGTWSVTVRLALSVGTATADLLTRAYIYRSGVFVLIGTLTLAAQSLTTSYTDYTLTGTLPSAIFQAGDKLYLDLWANVTTNGTGSGSATVNWGDLQSTAPASTQAQWVTPGYQPLTNAQLLQGYRYGAFTLHDGTNYLVQQKDFEFPGVKETLFKVARFEGMKKTGEVVNERNIAVTVRVLASSRANLEQQLDALYQALALRQQKLTLHNLDGRYWIADAIAGKASFSPGKIVSVTVPITFLCQQPYALGASQSSYASGNLVLSQQSGTTWQSGVVTFPGGGTIYTRPTITLTNNTPTNNNVLGTGLTSGVAATSLTIAAPGLAAAVAAGQVFVLNDGAGHTQTVTASASALAAATTLAVTSFLPNFSYPATTTSVDLDTTLSSVSLVQNTDGQTLTIASFTLANGQSLLITCDPIAANGETVLLNGAGNPLVFAGVFPLLEPTVTTWQMTAVGNNQPTVSLQWQWTARWVS